MKHFVAVLCICIGFLDVSQSYLKKASFPRIKPPIVHSPYPVQRKNELAQNAVHAWSASIIAGSIPRAVNFAPALNVAKAALLSAVVKLGFIKSADTFIPVHIHASPQTFGMIAGFILLLGMLRENRANPYDDADYETGGLYNPQRANRFYKLRPHLVVKRLMRIAWLALSFNFALLLDWRLGNLKKNEDKRAQQALRMLSLMGPTFIKLGQALSIRTDLVPVAYAKAFKNLQDAVPPFDSVLAKKIVCNELKISHLGERFRTFSAEPVAAASIGQVFKATLLDGREVAVKVQRPNILASIGLDLFVMRQMVPLQVRISNAITGVATLPADIELGYSLVDEWGKGLVAEVDYRQEACNTAHFNSAMAARGLHAVISPAVVEDLSSCKVLTTEWIDGARLDRDGSPDVPRLCGLALNAYLTMMLDTGVLHCDPHPGNLLRTRDGRLCILDWGMTICLPKDLQYSLLEFIAHCNAEDFSKLPEDFVQLHATPPDKIEELRSSGIPEGLAYVMRQLSKGGGPTQLTGRLREQFKAKYGDNLSDAELSLKVREEMVENADMGSVSAGDPEDLTGDVSGVAGILEMMSKRNRDIFKLPAYMLYVFRAFTVLEGIGLSINPDYSILNECYPYLAKRLMTDNSPRSRRALRDMLYQQNGRLDPEKILEMSEGFTSYTASTTTPDSSGEGQRKAQEALTELLLDSEGNMMQDVLLDGTAQVADSMVRVGINRARRSPIGRAVKAVLKTPKTIVDMSVPESMKMLALPMTLPYDVSKAIINLVDVEQSDVQNVKSIRLFTKNMQPRVRKQLRDAVLDSTVRRGKVRRRRRKAAADVERQAAMTSAEAVDLDDAAGDANADASSNTRRSRRRSPRQVLLPLSMFDSNRIRQRLGAVNRFNRRIPVVMRLTRKLGANYLSTTATRLQEKREFFHEISTAPYGEEDDVDDSMDYEIELLMTESLGSLSAATARSLANVLDRSKRYLVDFEQDFEIEDGGSNSSSSDTINDSSSSSSSSIDNPEPQE